MQPHPEGGYYVRTYQSDQMIQIGRGKERYLCTSIYYLLEQGDRSCFHRIRSDEIWFFHAGDPLDIFVIQDGHLQILRLGIGPDNEAAPQLLIPANTWFAARVAGQGAYALVSCVVAPGFDFDDFELAGREELLRAYPQYETVIRELTR